MEQPKDYNKALYLLQGADISLYLIAGIVICEFVRTRTKQSLNPEPIDSVRAWLESSCFELSTSSSSDYYVGDTASSPALGNVGRTLSRIAYGVAIPTIIIAGVINGNVAAKLTMQRMYVSVSWSLCSCDTPNFPLDYLYRMISLEKPDLADVRPLSCPQLPQEFSSLQRLHKDRLDRLDCHCRLYLGPGIHHCRSNVSRIHFFSRT